MTLEELLDREAIRHTMASYTVAGDRLKEEDFLAVFTEDAIFESEGVPESDAFRHEGKAAIRQWMTRWRHPPEQASPVHAATFVRHHLSTCHITLTGPDTARARTYWVAHTDIGPDHSGVYLDTFRKVNGDWLIAHRKVRLDWRDDNSLFTTAISRTR